MNRSSKSCSGQKTGSKLKNIKNLRIHTDTSLEKACINLEQSYNSRYKEANNLKMGRQMPKTVKNENLKQFMTAAPTSGAKQRSNQKSKPFVVYRSTKALTVPQEVNLRTQQRNDELEKKQIRRRGSRNKYENIFSSRTNSNSQTIECMEKRRSH